jgi:2-iminobutanoate/2-iminopropanoate deaminase
MKNGFQTFGFGMPWEEAYGFSQALRSGPTLYISGQLSHDMVKSLGVVFRGLTRDLL